MCGGVYVGRSVCVEECMCGGVYVWRSVCQLYADELGSFI
jgi:hypothetical protein